MQDNFKIRRDTLFIMQIQTNPQFHLVANVATISKNSNEEQQTTLEKEESNKDKGTIDKLTPDETQQLHELQARDTEVRAHESAHQAAGGGLTGAASFTYEKGPDGKMYAIGGEVPIAFKAGSTPQETIANAQQVIAAALAPANPSPQDHAVATSAHLMLIKAEQKLTQEAQEQIKGKETYALASNEENSTKTQEKTSKIDTPI